MMLCDRCSDLFKGRCDTQPATNRSYLKPTDRKSDYVRQNKDIWDLKRLQESNGCFICHRVWDTCREKIVAQPNWSWKFSIERTVRLEAPDCHLGYLSILIWVEDFKFSFREYIDIPINPLYQDLMNSECRTGFRMPHI
jgi:hypothetical protein